MTSESETYDKLPLETKIQRLEAALSLSKQCSFPPSPLVPSLTSGINEVSDRVENMVWVVADISRS